jgi:hypothetical protein
VLNISEWPLAIAVHWDHNQGRCGNYPEMETVRASAFAGTSVSCHLFGMNHDTG